jgi:predicted RNase H-like HicB family nuclease
MSNHYSARIHWSEQDSAFLAIVDELPGCIADGKTPQEALGNLATVIDEWIEVAKEDGRPIPKPLTLESFDQKLRASREELERHLQSEVAAAVSKAMNVAEEKPSVGAPDSLWSATVGNVGAVTMQLKLRILTGFTGFTGWKNRLELNNASPFGDCF